MAQAALRAAGEALSEQNKERDRASVNLDTFSSTRFKRSINAMEMGVDVASSHKKKRRRERNSEYN